MKDERESNIKINTEVVKPFLVNYSDAYILVTGNITVVGGNNDTKAAFKNCHPFNRAVIHLNDEYVDNAENLDLIMKMHNLIEYYDNYADSTTSLYHFKRQEQNRDGGNIIDLTTDSPSFKYKSSLLGDSTPVAADVNPNVPQAHRARRNAKIVVPLKYISTFFRSLQLSLVNTKLYMELAGLKII